MQHPKEERHDVEISSTAAVWACSDHLKTVTFKSWAQRSLGLFVSGSKASAQDHAHQRQIHAAAVVLAKGFEHELKVKAREQAVAICRGKDGVPSAAVTYRELFQYDVTGTLRYTVSHHRNKLTLFKKYVAPYLLSHQLTQV